MSSVWRRGALALIVVAAAACSDDDGAATGTGSRDAFCAELRDAVEGHLTIFDPLRPVTAEETTAATARLAEAAPPELAGAMGLLADSFAAVADLLAEVAPDDPEAAEQLEALDLDAEAIAAAQEEVAGYALRECRIDLAAINAASVTTTPAPPPTPPTATVAPTTVPPVSE